MTEIHRGAFEEKPVHTHAASAMFRMPMSSGNWYNYQWRAGVNLVFNRRVWARDHDFEFEKKCFEKWAEWAETMPQFEERC